MFYKIIIHQSPYYPSALQVASHVSFCIPPSFPCSSPGCRMVPRCPTMGCSSTTAPCTMFLPTKDHNNPLRFRDASSCNLMHINLQTLYPVFISLETMHVYSYKIWVCYFQIMGASGYDILISGRGCTVIVF